MMPHPQTHMPLVILGLLVVVGGCAGERPVSGEHETAMVRAQLDDHVLAFDMPKGFALGRIAEGEHLWSGLPTLVEPIYLEKVGRDEVPVGEFPAITFALRPLHHLELAARVFEEDPERWRAQVAGRSVYRLPGFPGPYGHTAHYYLVPLSDDVLLEVTGHRRHWSQAGEPLIRYDEVIERLIARLDVTHPVR